MDKENVCLYKLVIRWMYEEMDNAWIIERVGEWVNDWVITWRCEQLSQWVSDEMREEQVRKRMSEIMRVNERMKKSVN